MTNLHFCERCNKLRLTCEGKLRPCLGSHLEFDIKTPMRKGASDEQLGQFFGHVIERNPNNTISGTIISLVAGWSLSEGDA
jgi:cyclic pyranopterin phosphate synthase